MKRFPLIAALALAVTIVACNDMPVAPDVNFELVDSEQLRVTDANIDLVATFKVDVTGGEVYLGTEAGVPGINDEGKAHGTCFTGGRWMNPSNKKFAAKVPHANCTVTGTQRVVGLESITAAHWTQDHGSGTNLRTSYKLALDEDGELYVEWHAASGQESNREMRGRGVVVAHGVDEDGVRYGQFEFDLAQFGATPKDANLFGEYEAQTEGGGIEVFGLSRSIEATFTHPDGSTEPVEGTLYWTEK